MVRRLTASWWCAVIAGVVGCGSAPPAPAHSRVVLVPDQGDLPARTARRVQLHHAERTFSAPPVARPTPRRKPGRALSALCRRRRGGRRRIPSVDPRADRAASAGETRSRRATRDEARHARPMRVLAQRHGAPGRGSTDLRPVERDRRRALLRLCATAAGPTSAPTAAPPTPLSHRSTTSSPTMATSAAPHHTAPRLRRARDAEESTPWRKKRARYCSPVVLGQEESAAGSTSMAGTP